MKYLFGKERRRNMPPLDMITHLAISGGGIKGIAVVGALKVLEERGILEGVSTFVGSSVGGLIATLLRVGYRAVELTKIVEEVDFADYMDYDFISFFDNFGLVAGERIMALIAHLIESKGVSPEILLGDLPGLVLTGSNISRARLEVFSAETTPTMPLLLALRITIAYPLFFTPVEHQGDLYIDGALFCPYPMTLLEGEGDTVPCEERIGILIDSERIFRPNLEFRDRPDCFDAYLATLVGAVIHKYTRELSPSDFSDTIGIDLGDISSMNFEITADLKRRLYTEGELRARTYFESLDTP